MGYIYLIRSTKTIRVYVGQTIGTVEHRFYEHKQCALRLLRSREEELDVKSIQFSYLYNAMVHHGIDTFTVEILIEVENSKLDDHEIAFIKQFDSLAPNGYNLTTGGSANYRHSEVTKRLMSQQKLANVDAVRNEKLRGLPGHTAYRNYPEKGEEILINGHPLCDYATFSARTYGSFEDAKVAVIEFIKDLEEKGVKYTPKKDPDLPVGVSRIPGGYRVNKVHKGVNYDYKAKSKRDSDEQRKQKALAWYHALMERLGLEH